ncbi:MAG: hypothetical protein R3E95_12545 [Thiolinea sp.]
MLLLPVAVIAAENSSGEGTTHANPSYTNTELLNNMLIVEVSEQNLDNVPALGVSFSQNLKTDMDFDRFLTVTQNGKSLEGGWVLASHPRRLYFTHIQPDTEYRVQVRPGIESQAGLKLQKPGDYQVKTRDVQPAFDFASRGNILPAKLTNGLPVRVVNVPELDLEFLRVRPDKLKDVLDAMRLDGDIRSWELNDINAVTESVYSGRYVTSARRNARETRLLPVENIAALQEPGLYFAIMRKPGEFGDNAYRISHFVVTNIGLHVRRYDKKLEVFSHALDSGKPLADVKLQLQGKEGSLEGRYR